MKENRCFFQVSCIRCHIVRIQGDWRKICQICVQLNKQTNKGEKIWNFCFGVISFEYRERKKKETPWNLSDFQQIQVQFYQLFATVMRWSLENLKEIDKNYRSFDERVKIFFWNFLDFFGYFWNFLEKCVPVKNLSIWFHGVNALLFPTVLSHSELRKTFFFGFLAFFT